MTPEQRIEVEYGKKYLLLLKQQFSEVAEQIDQLMKKRDLLGEKISATQQRILDILEQENK